MAYIYVGEVIVIKNIKSNFNIILMMFSLSGFLGCNSCGTSKNKKNDEHRQTQTDTPPLSTEDDASTTNYRKTSIGKGRSKFIQNAQKSFNEDQYQSIPFTHFSTKLHNITVMFQPQTGSSKINVNDCEVLLDKIWRLIENDRE